MRSISTDGQLRELRENEIRQISRILREVVLSSIPPTRGQIPVLLKLLDRWEGFAGSLPGESPWNWHTNLPTESKELYRQAKHFTEIIRKLYGDDVDVEAKDA